MFFFHIGSTWPRRSKRDGRRRRRSGKKIWYDSWRAKYWINVLGPAPVDSCSLITLRHPTQCQEPITRSLQLWCCHMKWPCYRPSNFSHGLDSHGSHLSDLPSGNEWIIQGSWLAGKNPACVKSSVWIAINSCSWASSWSSFDLMASMACGWPHGNVSLRDENPHSWWTRNWLSYIDNAKETFVFYLYPGSPWSAWTSRTPWETWFKGKYHRNHLIHPYTL